MAALEFRLRDALTFGLARALRAPFEIVLAIAAVTAGVGAAIWVAAPAITALAGAAVQALDGAVGWGDVVRGQGGAIGFALVLAVLGFWFGNLLTLRALTPGAGAGFLGVAAGRHPVIALVKVIATWPLAIAVLGATAIFGVRFLTAEAFAPAVVIAVSGALCALVLHGAVSVRLSSAPAFAALGDSAPVLAAWRGSAQWFWSLALAHIAVLVAASVWIAALAAGFAVVFGPKIMGPLASAAAEAASVDGSAVIEPGDALVLGALMATLWIGPRVLGQGVHGWFARTSGAGQAAARDPASSGAR